MAQLWMRLAVTPVAIGVSVATLMSQAPATQGGITVALIGARVIDGTGSAPIQNATLLVSNGRVERVGSASSLKIPAGATRVQASGRTIIPGLINAHAHLNNGDRQLPLYDQIIQQLRHYARFGVTTAFALGDDGKESVRVRDENARENLDRARLFVAGPAAVAKSAEDARALIAQRHALRINAIKTRMNGNANDMTPEAYGALIDEAHKRNLIVTSHVFNLNDAKGLVAAGLDVIAHSIRDHDVDAAFVADLKRRNVGYIPTLTRDLSVFLYDSTPAFLGDPFFLRGAPLFGSQMERVKDPTLHAKTKQSPGAQNAGQWLDQAMRNLKTLSDGGVMIAMGTDSGTGLGRWQGYFEHVEMELMVKAGMTPMQVLTSASGGAARVMRLDGELGTLQPGKRADFLVLRADPLADIRNTRTIESVWINGRLTQ